MAQEKNSDMIERRSYFRIDDVTLLHHRVIEGDDAENSVRSDKYLLDKLTLKAKFDAISRELQPLQRIIGTSNPSIANYLAAMDKKLDILAEYIIDAEMSDIGISPQETNIGAGGMSFLSESPVMTGALLEMRIVLLPENTGIFSYARVVSCTRIRENNDSANGYKIAVEFEHMDDEVRDIICRHVLTVERESISNKLRA